MGGYGKGLDTASQPLDKSAPRSHYGPTVGRPQERQRAEEEEEGEEEEGTADKHLTDCLAQSVFACSGEYQVQPEAFI